MRHLDGLHRLRRRRGHFLRQRAQQHSEQFPESFSITNNVYVKWEKEHGLYKAEFWHEGRQVEVWFQPDGTWVRTERDLSPMELPEAVKNYVAHNYPGYRVDDVDFVETPAGNYYELELEKNGTRDIILRLTVDATPV